MPGSGHRRRGVVLLMLGIGGTVFLIWACTQSQSSSFELLLLFGICVSVPALTISCTNFWQGAQADKLYRSEESLARWTLSYEERQMNAETAYQSEKPSLAVGIIVYGVLVLIGFVFKLIAFQSMNWNLFLLCMLGLAAIVLYFAVVIPWLQRRRMRRDPPDVVIGLYGATLPGQHVLWNRRQLGVVIARVRSVSLVRERDGDVLIVLYEWLERHGFVERSCRIPVPDGKRVEAADAGRKIAEAGGVVFRDETETA